MISLLLFLNAFINPPYCLCHFLLPLLEHLNLDFSSHEIIFNTNHMLLFRNRVADKVKSLVLKVGLIKFEDSHRFPSDHAFEVLHFISQLVVLVRVHEPIKHNL
jgi:hypothetical protein